MEINASTRVGDIVKVNYKTAQIFDKNDIDFCCGGGISIQKACERSNTDMNKLIAELEDLTGSQDPESAYINGLSLTELCDYIEKRHHGYVRENIPFLVQKLNKLCSVHGENHPELFEVNELFQTAAENLLNHMKDEETILFPYIRKMEEHNNENPGSENEFGEIFKTINVMIEEHQAEGERLAQISSITDNYTCPPDGCNTYNITYQTLKDFEQDLHRHVHLENNILFSRAQELEKELTN